MFVWCFGMLVGCLGVFEACSWGVWRCYGGYFGGVVGVDVDRCFRPTDHGEEETHIMNKSVNMEKY